MSNPFDRLERLQPGPPRGYEPEDEAVDDLREAVETTEAVEATAAVAEGPAVFASSVTEGAVFAGPETLEPVAASPEPMVPRQLAQVLADEQRRLLQRREEITAEQRRIEAEIAAIDGRIGHVDALLTADQPGQPPMQLRGIGARAVDAA